MEESTGGRGVLRDKQDKHQNVACRSGEEGGMYALAHYICKTRS